MTLFSPLSIEGVTLRNRIVMPPMVCLGWADENGAVTRKHILHYSRRAKGGAGLIVVEATCVHPRLRSFDTQLGLWRNENIAPLAELVSACHQEGAAVFVQLAAGPFRPSGDGEGPGLPSPRRDVENSRELTAPELELVRSSYIAAALRAQAAGADGVELHMAHGFLLSQFASAALNARHDGYGGEDASDRLRLIGEIIAGIRSSAPGFPVSVRMGGNEPTMTDGIVHAGLLVKAGVCLLSVSNGGPMSEPPQLPDGFRYNYIPYMAGEIKRFVSLPVIAVNGIRTPERAAWLFDNGFCDLVAIGRDMLADPDWTLKCRDGRPISYCMGCRTCRFMTDGDSCPVKQKRVADVRRR